MSLNSRTGLALSLSLLVGSAAMARSELAWDGNYFGMNLGSAASHLCSSWEFAPAAGATFGDSGCDTKNAFVGGLQIGENYQVNRLVAGWDVSLDYWHGTAERQSVAASAGKFGFSNREAPAALALLTGRFGFDAGSVFPYLRVGGAVAPGAHDSDLYFTPTGAGAATAKFTGGKDLAIGGWAAGGGLELVLTGPWTLSAEYLHVSLGKGSNSSSSCSGSATACAPFAGASFTTAHEGFTANVVRIGITYWLGY